MTTTLDADLTVETFANAVRGELFDLDAEAVDDLTDGLEADLADKLADGEALGDPGAYAAELRAAAGLAPAARRSIVDGARASFADLRSRVAPFIAHRAVAEVIAFFVALRPLWWVIRAWGLFYIFTGFHAFPGNSFDPPFAIALLVLSIQWGRGRWLPWKWSRGAVVVLGIMAVLALPSITTSVVERVTFADQMDPNDYISDGILLDKQQVTNIFAYDADGEPLTGVRLYDQDGDPLAVVSELWGNRSLYDPRLGDSSMLVPSDQVAGSPGWNVYPLQSAPSDSLDYDTGEVHSWAKRSDVTPPFASVQPLVAH
jgi:hypothetical protein